MILTRIVAERWACRFDEMAQETKKRANIFLSDVFSGYLHGVKRGIYSGDIEEIKGAISGGQMDALRSSPRH